MKPPEGFSEKVRARVIELTGEDPGAFTIGSFTPGPRWPELSEAEQIDTLAKSIAERDKWLDETALKNHTIDLGPLANIEDSCGCIWCDLEIAFDQEGKHHTARGEFPCTRER